LATGEYEIGLCIETRLKQSQRWNDWKKGWEGAKHVDIRERTQTMIKRADSMLNPFFSFVDDNRIGRARPNALRCHAPTSRRRGAGGRTNRRLRASKLRAVAPRKKSAMLALLGQLRRRQADLPHEICRYAPEYRVPLGQQQLLGGTSLVQKSTNASKK
jgi:hypothetical protein